MKFLLCLAMVSLCDQYQYVRKVDCTEQVKIIEQLEDYDEGASTPIITRVVREYSEGAKTPIKIDRTIREEFPEGASTPIKDRFDSIKVDSKNLMKYHMQFIGINPRTTFTVFNHPPDFGNAFNQPGKAANNENGSAIAIENPNIPTIGAIPPFEAASTNNVPTIGPVQENDTMAKAKAMKKIPIKPPLSA